MSRRHPVHTYTGCWAYLWESWKEVDIKLIIWGPQKIIWGHLGSRPHFWNPCPRRRSLPMFPRFFVPHFPPNRDRQARARFTRTVPMFPRDKKKSYKRVHIICNVNPAINTPVQGNAGFFPLISTQLLWGIILDRENRCFFPLNPEAISKPEPNIGGYCPL